jgi:hypothetical protein
MQDAITSQRTKRSAVRASSIHQYVAKYATTTQGRAHPGASNPPASVDKPSASRSTSSASSSGVRRTIGIPNHVATSASTPSATTPNCIPLVDSGIVQAVSARQALAAHRSHATSTATAVKRLAA